MTSRALDRAAGFLQTHARALEQRLFDRAFRDGNRQPVIDAVLSYRNDDGGFGKALEPDLRATSSQPVFLHFALLALREGGASSLPDADRTCAWLASVSTDGGAVPYILPVALDSPHAAHWNSAHGLEPSLHATAGVAAGLLSLGVVGEWLSRASEWCLGEIADTPEYSGHRMLNVLDFLGQLPPSAEVERQWSRTTERLFESDYVAMQTPLRVYGLRPLHFAPTPDCRARALFSSEVIARHLDDLLSQQQTDGGWPITWDPPPGSAVDEWRGRWTLDALMVLRAYGRL